MSTHTYREVLHEVQQLSLEEQKQLLKDLMTMLQRQEQLEGKQEAIQQQKSAILQQLAQSQKESSTSLQHPKETEPLHSILELEGLGAEIWKDVDVDQYIEQERNSWDG